MKVSVSPFLIERAELIAGIVKSTKRDRVLAWEVRQAGHLAASARFSFSSPPRPFIAACSLFLFAAAPPSGVSGGLLFISFLFVLFFPAARELMLSLYNLGTPTYSTRCTKLR